jgi:hypothetical protein
MRLIQLLHGEMLSDYHLLLLGNMYEAILQRHHLIQQHRRLHYMQIMQRVLVYIHLVVRAALRDQDAHALLFLTQ